eukprot:GSChrysophyteH2.ASY1.ANO1.200.1 assembled CDS
MKKLLEMNEVAGGNFLGINVEGDDEMRVPPRASTEDQQARRMTTIEQMVPDMYRPFARKKLDGEEDTVERRKDRLLEKKLKKKKKVKAREAEQEAIRLRSDLSHLKKNIARAQMMLEKYALTESNKLDLEDKIDHWNSLLYARHKGPQSAAEKAMQERELNDRMTLYHENKGLSDVFKVFWYLVLPYCIRDPVSGEDYLTKNGYLKFNANLYIALTGCTNKLKCLRHAFINWMMETRDPNRSKKEIHNEEALIFNNGNRSKLKYQLDTGTLTVPEIGDSDDPYLGYIPPPGVKVLLAPQNLNLPEGSHMTCISREKFYSSLFEVLDSWAELMNPEYYSIFAWSLLDSVGDTTVFPPKLRLPGDVTNTTCLDSEMAMLNSFTAGSQKRRFLTIDREALTKVPEILARLAARKKGTTISEAQSQRIKEIYAKLKKEGKIHGGDTLTDSDDSDARRRMLTLDEYNSGEDDGEDDGSSSGDSYDYEASRERRKREEERRNGITSRRLEISDMEVKTTLVAQNRQRTKFVKDDSLDMKNQKNKSKPGSPKSPVLVTRKRFVVPAKKSQSEIHAERGMNGKFASSQVQPDELPQGPPPPFDTEEDEVKYHSQKLLASGNAEEFQKWKSDFMTTKYQNTVERTEDLFEIQFGNAIKFSQRRAKISAKLGDAMKRRLISREIEMPPELEDDDNVEVVEEILIPSVMKEASQETMDTPVVEQKRLPDYDRPADQLSNEFSENIGVDFQNLRKKQRENALEALGQSKDSFNMIGDSIDTVSLQQYQLQAISPDSSPKTTRKKIRNSKEAKSVEGSSCVKDTQLLSTSILPVNGKELEVTSHVSQQELLAASLSEEEGSDGQSTPNIYFPKLEHHSIQISPKKGSSEKGSNTRRRLHPSEVAKLKSKKLSVSLMNMALTKRILSKATHQMSIKAKHRNPLLTRAASDGSIGSRNVPNQPN